jgi:hypothetical protein
MLSLKKTLIIKPLVTPIMNYLKYLKMIKLMLSKRRRTGKLWESNYSKRDFTKVPSNASKTVKTNI